MKRLSFASAGLFAILLFATQAMAQAPGGQGGSAPEQSPSTNVAGLLAVVHTVVDLDRSLAFYREVFGLEAAPQQNASGFDPKILRKTAGVPDLKARGATLHIPGAAFDLRLVEFQGGRKDVRKWQVLNPGNVNLNFAVRDIDTAVTAAKMLGATSLTTGGAPMVRGRASRATWAIFMQDPDGYEFEMEQTIPARESPLPATSKTLGANLGITVSDGEKLLAFYKGVGFSTRLGAAFSAPSDGVGMGLLGAEWGQLRASTISITQPQTPFFVFEIRGLEGRQDTPHLSLQDVGANGISLKVDNIAKALSAVMAGGGAILPKDGMATSVGASKIAWVTDPDGRFWELVETAQ